MLAYNKTGLQNEALKSITNKAFRANLITDKEQDSINTAYPIGFYSPNIFVRIGLGLLALVVNTSITGLLLLVIDSASNEPVILFMGIACFGGLELFIRNWKHYRSGIDDVLLHAGILLIITWMSVTFQWPEQEQGMTIAFVALLLYSFSFIRYLDRLCGLLAPASLIFLIYYAFSRSADHPPAGFFFVIAISMMAIFFLVRKIRSTNSFPFHKNGLAWIEYGSAILCYGSLHYYFVELVTGQKWTSQQSVNNDFLGWFSWAWTILLPPLILAWGIRTKKLPWIRIGLILVITLFAYLQYQVKLVDHEIAAIVFGLLLIIIAYLIIKHLKINNLDYSDEPDTDNPDWPLTEVVAISAGFSQQATNLPANQTGNTNYGGGDFGGGGAGGQF